MKTYSCKVAALTEIEKLWNEKQKNSPDDLSVCVWKNRAVEGFLKGNRIYYYGYIGDKVICEAAALLNKEEVQNGEGLAGGDTAYLSAFKTAEEYRGKGYFSVLYKYMEEDLKKRGYKKLTLGVEPCEVKNMMIYFKWGYTEFIKTAFEEYPPKNEGEEAEKILVNYYMKKL